MNVTFMGVPPSFKDWNWSIESIWPRLHFVGVLQITRALVRHMLTQSDTILPYTGDCRSPASFDVTPEAQHSKTQIRSPDLSCVHTAFHFTDYNSHNLIQS